jgi:hypothetical protein
VTRFEGNPKSSVPVVSRFANAFAPAKTAAATATAPTPSNGFNANAIATPATNADFSKSVVSLNQ